jgi:hypothetical protein
MSKYAILTNKPLSKEFRGAYFEMTFNLPFWFSYWDHKKIIKVYGCSFAYLESENKEPVLSNRQFISVHSNIIREDSEYLPSAYIPPVSKDTPSQNESEANSNFMMVVNNFYTPKVYDVTNLTDKQIIIYFRDSKGEKIPITTSYSSQGDLLDEIYSAIFKLELELAIAK